MKGKNAQMKQVRFFTTKKNEGKKLANEASQKMKGKNL